MKKAMTIAAVLCIFLPVFFGCKNDVDESPNIDTPVANPFIGVWKQTDEKFWQFKTNGTGGTAASEAGPFRDDFSFLVHIKQDADETGYTSLVLVEDALPTDPDTSLVKVTRYTFSITGDEATLTLAGTEPPPVSTIALERVSGKPQALSLTNPLIGEWATKWTLNGTSWATPETNRWSLKYRADGTLKTYHLSAGHQFENAYALRGNTLVIYGQRRFTGQAGNAPPNPAFIAIRSEISYLGNDSWRVQELESYAPATGNAKASWIYTKVNAAKWKEE